MPRLPKITNEEILVAARQVFLEQGFGASTLEIAEKAGISEASIFKRFITKQGLFLNSMGITDQPQWSKVFAIPSRDIKTELRDICKQMLKFHQETFPRVMMVMAQGNMPDVPLMPLPPVSDSQLLAEYLERAIVLDYLHPCDSLTLAQLIVGAIINYVIADNSANKHPFPEPFQSEPAEFIHKLIETLWTGIAPV